MCLDKHYMGMRNPGLYRLSSMKKILPLFTYPVYSHPQSLQSILPFISCWYFDAESGDTGGVGREEICGQRGGADP